MCIVLAMFLRGVVVGLFILSMVVPTANAQGVVCPNSNAFERCLERFDRNGDKELDLVELTTMISAASWYAKWALGSAESYMERCDADNSHTVSGMELMSSDCLPTCVQQRGLYTAVC